MSTEIEKREDEAAAIERVLITGDLGRLTPEQKVFHYLGVCESLGLNAKTNPFLYLKLNGKTALYATKGCTDQLRSIRGISIRIVDRSQMGDVYTVTARATCNGREDEDEGSVNTKGLYGEALANSRMKALTKAKRRVTLSLAGLGMLDESEVETIPGAVTQMMDLPVAKVLYPSATEVISGDLKRATSPKAFNEPNPEDKPEDYLSRIADCPNDADVRNVLAEAEQDKSLTDEDFQELQLQANEHIDFHLGEES